MKKYKGGTSSLKMVGKRKKNTTHLRAYTETKMRIGKATKEISEIEGKKVTTPELLKRMSNVPDIKNILIRDAQIKKKMRRFNRRAQSLPFNIGAIFVIAVILFAIFGIFYIGSLFVPQLTNSLSDVTGVLSDVAQSDSVLNTTVQTTVVPLNTGVENMEWIGYSMLIVSIIAIFIMAFTVRAYPFLLPLWIGIVIVMVFMAIFLANSYEGILESDSDTRGLYESYPVNHFILSNLPFVIGITGLIGGFIMFVALATDPNRVGIEEAIV
jgi:hypothetical protein